MTPLVLFILVWKGSRREKRGCIGGRGGTAVSSWQLSFYVETGNRNWTGRWKEGTKAFLAFSLLIASKIATNS